MMRNEAKQVHQGAVIMKKIAVCLILFFLLCSCENLVTDLPMTTVGQFIDKPTLGTVTFPKGTKAIDIYNTVASLYSDNEWHDVTSASWKYVESTTTMMTSKGPVTTESYGSVNFSRIRYAHTSTDPEINIHTVYLSSDDSNTREIVFKWQRQTTNVWQNDAIEGVIVFTY
jgi:hypothetical protein